MSIKLDLEENEFMTVMQALTALTENVENECIKEGWKNLEEYEQENGCELEAKTIFNKMYKIMKEKLKEA